MQTYHKIETVYARDNKTKKLTEGMFLNPAVEFTQDLCWQFTEKIDGTNVRVAWDGHKVSFGGRTEDASIPALLVNKLMEMFGGEANAQLFEQKFGEKEVLLFGEGYGPKIQKVGVQYRDDVSFILFDVMIGGKFLERENMKDIAKYFGLDTVPVVLEGTIKEGIEYIKKKPQSTIGTAPMEGLVARPKVELQDARGERLIVKIKARDFE